MVIATFGPNTAWAGKKITREGDIFFFEGFGPISSQHVVDYDQQGLIVWESEGTRALVCSLAKDASVPSLGPAMLSQRIGYPPTLAPTKKSAPTLAIVGFTGALVAVPFAWFPLLGLPFLGLGTAGLVLSIIGMRQATRDKLPTGLASAGIVLGGIAVASAAVMYLLMFISMAVDSSSSY